MARTAGGGLLAGIGAQRFLVLFVATKKTIVRAILPTPMKRTIFTLALTGLALSLSACTKTPTNLPPLGPITATGTLIPAEVSLLRRGTHLLLVNGKKMYYVESKTEDLVSREGQTVYVEGVAESNTTKDDLPVLVLRSLESTRGDSGLKVWNIPALDIRLQAPIAWTASIQKSVASFSLPEETSPLLTVSISGSGSLPSGGSHYYLSGRRTVRMDDSSGEKTDVFIEEKEYILHLHFDLSSQKPITNTEDQKLLISQFDYILNSIKFLSDRETGASSSEDSIAAQCGGEANIVCPEGSFCDVTDLETKIGHCRLFKR